MFFNREKMETAYHLLSKNKTIIILRDSVIIINNNEILSNVRDHDVTIVLICKDPFRITSWEEMEPKELVFNFDSTAKMDTSDEEIVKMALKQVERTMKDLSERSSQGYAIGYELGYIKGVLEHVLKTIPDSQDKEAYMKGYVNGYIQGMLYSFKQGDLEREKFNFH